MHVPTRADGELDYTCAVDPLGVRDYALSIAKPLAGPFGLWRLPQALALFAHVSAMTYVADPLGVNDFVQSPLETLRHRAGNCAALTVLFTSLARSIGIPTRMLGLDDPTRDGGHLLAELFIGGYDLDDLPDDLDDCRAPRWLRQIYDEDAVLGNMYFETERENRWLFLDPVFSEFAGDIEALVEEGFMWFSPNGNDIEWEDAVYFSDGSDRMHSFPAVSTSYIQIVS
jgi:transglutaminase-like putative cysteine protease